MIVLLFLCSILNQTVSCQNPIEVISDINPWEIGLNALIIGGSVVGGIYLTQWVIRKQTRDRNSEAIQSALHDVIEGLGSYQARVYTTYNGWNIFYVSEKFPLSPYEGIIHSGEFTHFSGFLQRLLTIFVHVMNTRNTLLKEIEEIYRIFNIQDIRNWRSLKEDVELKELTVTNMEVYLLNDLLPRLLSIFGGNRWNHEFFAQESS